MNTSRLSLPSCNDIPEVTQNSNTTLTNAIDTNINTIPMSQPDLSIITTPTVTTNSFVAPSTVMHTPTTHLNNTSNIHVQTNNKLVTLHHDNNIHYVMEEYCKPINVSYICPQESCKFNRECIVSKNKVMTKGTLVDSISPTVFKHVPTTSLKNKYTTYDVRLVSCFNPSCKHPKTKMAKVFHHVCFMNMLKTNLTDEMELITIDTKKDKLVELIDDKIDVSFFNELSDLEYTNLSFPFCGKRCFNTITNYRNKISNKGDSEYATTQSWDSDGSSKHRTSITVLIDWFTTEENCSSYYGGVDSNG